MRAPTRHLLRFRYLFAVLVLGVIIAHATPSAAQSFDSGSDGSDGALVFEANVGVVLFDPVALGLDTDGDNVFHFTTIDVPDGAVVRLRADVLGGAGRPVVWLASGDVRIAGTLDLGGEDGHDYNRPHVAAVAGAGGYSGGIGAADGLAPTPGDGPGAGAAGAGTHGGAAGHVLAGLQPEGTAAGGSAYGNRFLLPLLGGSGGGGGDLGTGDGAGGGAGGGAILIASSTSITLTSQTSAPSIDASGGDAGGAAGGGILAGGAGSAGAIRLIAPIVSGNGRIDVRGGLRSNLPGLPNAANGRIRIEAHRNEIAGTILPIGAITTARPGLVFLPDTAPSVVVTNVGGVEVTPGPSGRFDMPDAVIDSDLPVTIEIAARNIPPGTQVELTISPEDGALQKLTSSPLEGTRANSTASVAGVTFPHGVTRVLVVARWGP